MKRIDKLRKAMAEAKLDGFFINSPENRRYFSGFTGSEGYLLITHTQSYLLTDFRYLEQAAGQAKEFEIVKIQNEPFEELTNLASGLRRLGLEGDVLSYVQYEAMKKALPDVELVSTPELLISLRAVKDEAEIELIKKAVAIADDAFGEIINTLREGQSEEEISLTLEFLMRKAGASGRSFDFIVASGERSSLPHGVASAKRIQRGEFVTLDFGAIYQGYCSDITRTVVIGEPDDKQVHIYNIVLQAQLIGIDAVKPGRSGREVDHEVRQFIKEAGYGDYFGHGLGHSVGLAIHERPRLNPREEKLLEPGMIVTVEPGIYIPNWGGVRIEDMVLVTDSGCEVLTKSPKELISL